MPADIKENYLKLFPKLDLIKTYTPVMFSCRNISLIFLLFIIAVYICLFVLYILHRVGEDN